jgi:hypothetical protein
MSGHRPRAGGGRGPSGGGGSVGEGLSVGTGASSEGLCEAAWEHQTGSTKNTFPCILSIHNDHHYVREKNGQVNCFARATEIPISYVIWFSS